MSTMKAPTTDAVTAVLSRFYEPPSWLLDSERIQFRTAIRTYEDSYIIIGELFDLENPREGRYKSAERSIPGKAILSATRTAAMGALVDMLHHEYISIMEELEPPMPADDLLELMMQAFGDDQACDVLADAGLEREAIKPPVRGIPRRADTRTDDEKVADLRAELHRKAKAWARPFVEILFRRNWSTKPWATDPPRLTGHAVITSIDRNARSLTLSGLRDRVRRLSDLQEAQVFTDEQVYRLLSSIHEP